MSKISKCICSCVDVDVGSYDNQVMLPIPAHMKKYERARVKAGLSPSVCIDRCILPQVQTLWAKGVKTSGCCCGHGKIGFSYISVLDSADANKMESLGYEHLDSSLSAAPELHFLA